MPTLYVSPDGGPVQINGRTVKTITLGTAINRATPGDLVQLTQGTYTKSVVISDGGTAEHPITIRGGLGVILDGKTDKHEAIGVFEPQDDDFAFIKVITANWIIVEELEFRNCWPSAFFLRGTKDIVLRKCKVTGSRFVVYARNKRPGLFSPGIKAKRITLEEIIWVQDADEEMWKGQLTWSQVKDNTSNGHSYFNGALFGSWDIRGDVTIRGCRVSHAFNAIRMDCKPDPDLTRRRNVNVEIANNYFDHIRDNVFEPENSAINWWIYNNEVRNSHAAFSLHNASGGYWYIFSNLIWFDSQPGQPGQGHRGGTTFKFLSEPYPAHPIYVFHNSFYIRGTYAKDGQTRHLKHFNNAIEFCFDGPYCISDRKFFWTDDSRFTWHESYEFDQDLSNHPDYPDRFPPEYRYVLSGIPSNDIFASPATGDLKLLHGSPGRGSARALELTMSAGPPWPSPAGADIGAMQNDVLFKGPKFVRFPEEQA